MALTSASPQGAFVARRQRDWEHLDSLVRKVQQRGLRHLSPDDVARLSPLYLDLCADLARAQAARYGGELVEYLQGLTAAAHALVYGRASSGRAHVAAQRGFTWRRALEAFPRAVRAHRRAMLVSFLLFFVPLFAGLAAALHDPSFAGAIAPESMLEPLASSYRQGFEHGRGASMDAAMAGFYVNNNVGIALRCFATGITLGLGSAFYLVENGLITGAIMGYVAAHGGGDNLFTFVAGHGSLELGAIVLAGGAGLSIGWSIVAPGDRTRLESVQDAGRRLTVVVLGAAVMLFMAAAVEGFWSASAAPGFVKRAVGGVMFVTVIAYVWLAGRGADDDALESGERPWT